jgi:hypothetical protein
VSDDCSVLDVNDIEFSSTFDLDEYGVWLYFHFCGDPFIEESNLVEWVVSLVGRAQFECKSPCRISLGFHHMKPSVSCESILIPSCHQRLDTEYVVNVP